MILTEYFEDSSISIQTLSTSPSSIKWGFWTGFFCCGPRFSFPVPAFFFFSFFSWSSLMHAFTFLFPFSQGQEAALGKGLTASGVTFTSVGQLVWLEEVRMVWFVGVLEHEMTKGVGSKSVKSWDGDDYCRAGSWSGNDWCSIWSWIDDSRC